MAPNTYTEDEFKKILKILFAEKKRVKELEKRLEERRTQKKFYTKLSHLHRPSIAEEYSKLKKAYREKELECERFKTQLNHVRPILKKLLTELRNAQQEMNILKAPPAGPDLREMLVEEGERNREELLEQAYTHMRQFSKRYAETIEEQTRAYAVLHSALKKEEAYSETLCAEIRQAQHLLAKKVKETTMLRDVAERQKIQLTQSQCFIEKQQHEIEELHDHLKGSPFDASTEKNSEDHPGH